jgi:hypothetical protein
MIIDLLCLTFLIVFVIDYSGIIEEMEGLLTKCLKSQFHIHIPKPFSCSLCMTFWCGIGYLIIYNHFSLITLSYVAILAILTPTILDVINLIINNLNKLITKIY